MKTKLEWLQTLPEPYRTQALENVIEPNNIKDSLASAVKTMCCWGYCQ